MQQAALMAVGLVFCAAVLYAAIADLTTFTIPNWVSGILVLGFCAYALVRWSDIPLTMHLVLGLTTFVICVAFWRLGWLGGGDVKFLGATALWMGPQNIVPFILVLAIAGSAFAFLLMWVRKWNLSIQASQLPSALKNLVAKAEGHACPYGFPAAIAAIAMVPAILG
jgi:prepilin peptidase CpaA